jgi:hypothetical protein
VDEINAILGEALNSYLKEQTFKILGDPLPVEKADDSIDWKTQKDFEFEYKIGFVETIDVKLDSSIKGINYSIKVDQKLIDETIDNLTSQYGESTNPEVSEAADFIYGDLKSTGTDFSKTTSVDTAKLSKKLGLLNCNQPNNPKTIMLQTGDNNSFFTIFFLTVLLLVHPFLEIYFLPGVFLPPPHAGVVL